MKQRLQKFFSLDNLRKALNGFLLISLLFAWVAIPMQIAENGVEQLHSNYY